MPEREDRADTRGDLALQRVVVRAVQVEEVRCARAGLSLDPREREGTVNGEVEVVSPQHRPGWRVTPVGERREAVVLERQAYEAVVLRLGEVRLAHIPPSETGKRKSWRFQRPIRHPSSRLSTQTFRPR